MEKRYTFNPNSDTVGMWRTATNCTAIDYMVKALLMFRTTEMVTLTKEGTTVEYRLAATEGE